MKERPYDHQAVEAKWQEKWSREGIFNVGEDAGRKKYYCLEMFPYPSGRIHMGHVRNYAIGDVVARFQAMRGFNVLHPMGWDAFGMPAENAAIERQIHPAVWTRDNIAYMKGQLMKLGLSYDWRREVTTCDPGYYRWNQWIFLKMYERGLAYKKKSPVNWCDKCQTVLANEQVEDGACWRCGGTVSLRDLEGWFFKITAYAEELLEGCDKLKEGWPERVLTMQRNWIGKSLGARIDFPFTDREGKLAVFTTRQDTVYGATFLSLAPEHPLALELCRGKALEKEALAFIERCRKADRAARTAGDISKEGFNTGAHCLNPVTKEKIPVWLANFVLMDYGTGAVMAVPAHDQRDFDFAVKYHLPIRQVVRDPEGKIREKEMQAAFEEDGFLVNSGQFDGLSSAEAREKIVLFLEKKKIGGKAVNYRLRDWGISRQRYWGTPIPIIYCPKCGTVPVPYEDLPVILPEDITFEWEGGSPLAKRAAYHQAKCPQCKGPGRRDTDTMDTFVDSSWYFIKYASMPEDGKVPFDRRKAEYWMAVDQYIGGIEHAILHLMYSRFFTKVLRDLELIGVDEPFARLLTQGMVCKETQRCPEHGWLLPEDVVDGKCRTCSAPAEIGRTEKMSKSKKNLVDPESLIREYGADTARLFSLFAAPPEKDLEWSDEGVEGAYRFLKRVWRLVHRWAPEMRGARDAPGALSPEVAELRKAAHRTVKKVTQDIADRFHFNTAISALMEMVNAAGRVEALAGPADRRAVREALRTMLVLLAPFAPHMAEELWEELGEAGFVSSQPWPGWSEELIAEETVVVVVQVNGKVRGRLTVPAGMGQADVIRLAVEDPQVRKHLQGRTPAKTLYVPGRLVSLVTGPESGA